MVDSKPDSEPGSRPGSKPGFRPVWAPTREEFEQLRGESRLSIPPMFRIPAATLTAFGIGMALGLSYGSKMAGLRFRAEHAHRLPSTTTGWYLYHKSKNYHLVSGGLKEGVKVGAKLAFLSTSMFCVENLFDVYRGTKDMFNTTAAALAVAGGFSLWNGFSAPEAARTAKKGLKFGLVYGGIQDAISLAKGRQVGYIDFIRRHVGKPSQLNEQDQQLNEQAA